nr:carbohydrate-binding protein [Streptomyces sp. NBC_00974]
MNENGNKTKNRAMTPGVTGSLLAAALIPAAVLLAPVNSASAATGSGRSAPPAASPSRYEAENATLSQAVAADNHTGYSGAGFVDYTNVTGSYAQWSVNAATAGSATLTFRYANGSTTDRQMSISVNGTVVAAGKSFPGTGSWDTWVTTTITVPLSAGANTVRATAITAAGGPNTDYVDVTPQSATTGPGAMAAAPYEYLGWGSPQKPTDVMAATGVKWFTLAFILSDGGCNPKWDGSRALTGGADEAAINSIRGAGGDVMVSIGGWSGNKLGEKCTSATALAGAYQKVINAYHLKAIDIDIENTEFAGATVRQRVVDALKIVKANNPGIVTYVTMGTTPSGPDATGKDLINKGAAAGLANDGWVIMPFDFGGHGGTMGQASVSALEGLKASVKSAYGYGDDTAYRHIGVSSMNGKTDEPDETVTTTDFQTILSYAQQHHIARYAFWSVNRDRACATGTDPDACSGVSQSPYAFTKIVVQYKG